MNTARVENLKLVAQRNGIDINMKMIAAESSSSSSSSASLQSNPADEPLKRLTKGRHAG